MIGRVTLTRKKGSRGKEPPLMSKYTRREILE